MDFKVKLEHKVDVVLVNGKEYGFHCWEQNETQVFAILENLEDGTVIRVDPEQIKFATSYRER